MVKEREIPYTSPITIPFKTNRGAIIAFLSYKGMHILIHHHHSIVPHSVLWYSIRNTKNIRNTNEPNTSTATTTSTIITLKISSFSNYSSQSIHFKHSFRSQDNKRRKWGGRWKWDKKVSLNEWSKKEKGGITCLIPPPNSPAPHSHPTLSKATW